MYWMAGTMLAEAIVSFVYCLINKKKAYVNCNNKLNTFNQAA